MVSRGVWFFFFLFLPFFPEVDESLSRADTLVGVVANACTSFESIGGFVALSVGGLEKAYGAYSRATYMIAAEE